MKRFTNSKIHKMSPLLLVADINRSLEFYTKKLNFEIDFRYEDFYASIIKDGNSIHLKLKEDLINIRNKRNNEDPTIIFSISNIEELYIELSNTSVEVIHPIRNMPYGKEFYITDPDFNIIAFVEEG